MAGDHNLTENDHGIVGDAFVEHFDFDALDTAEARIRQAIADNEPVEVHLRDMANAMAQMRVNESASRLIAMIVDSKRPRLQAQAIAYAVGMAVNGGMSGAQIAKRNGVTKQAFTQLVSSISRRLGLRKTRTQRSAAGKAAMAKAYSRRVIAPKSITKQPTDSI